MISAAPGTWWRSRAVWSTSTPCAGRDAKPPAGGFLVALQDTTGSGKADVIKRFGESDASGGKGGTGIVHVLMVPVYAEVDDISSALRCPAGKSYHKILQSLWLLDCRSTAITRRTPFAIDADGTPTLMSHRRRIPVS